MQSGVSTTATVAASVGDTTQPRHGNRSALLYAVYCEIMKTIRVPMFTVSLFVLPAMLFSLFVLPSIHETQNGVAVGNYTMPSFGIYVVMMAGVFSSGIPIANERGMKWNLLLRATPMKLRTYFASKVIMSLLIGAAAATFFFIFARVTGGVDLGIAMWLKLLGTLLVAMLPFIALGLLIGYAVGPQAAAGVANLIVLPLSFMSGLFIPYDSLPHFARQIAPYLPAYHAGQLGWHLIGAGDDTSVAVHLLWVAGYTLVFVAGAIWFYRRDEGKTFG
ncbi:MAG TPA: ABC transporter permease [Thermomicrobiales bacterium]|nr:ABC transporter permease [Thermomicrobiales bacterium]